MNVSVIGNGNVGGALGDLFAQVGHSVVFGSRQPDGANKVTIADALEQGEVVVLAVPYAAALELAEQEATKAALQGKVVIDVTNPLTPDFMSLTVGHTSSAGEEIAKRLPGAHVVKAFNTLFADVMKAKAAGEAVPFTVFVAGDDASAKNTVQSLVKAIGLDVVDAGSLSNARYLESIIEQEIQLAYGLGHGPRIGFTLSTLGAQGAGQANGETSSTPTEIVSDFLNNTAVDKVEAAAHRLVADDATYISLNFDNPQLKQILPWTGTSQGPQAFIDTFTRVAKFWTIEEFSISDLFGAGENVAVFGAFTYRSNSVGKAFRSPFSIHAKVQNGRIVYFQFMEDTFASARSFSASGTWTIQTDPNGPTFEV